MTIINKPDFTWNPDVWGEHSYILCPDPDLKCGYLNIHKFAPVWPLIHYGPENDVISIHHFQNLRDARRFADKLAAWIMDDTNTVAHPELPDGAVLKWHWMGIHEKQL